MCDAGIENPKKNVWLNKSIYPLNKTFLLGKKAKNTFFTQEAKPKKKCFHFGTQGYEFLVIVIVIVVIIFYYDYIRVPTTGFSSRRRRSYIYHCNFL